MHLDRSGGAGFCIASYIPSLPLRVVRPRVRNGISRCLTCLTMAAASPGGASVSTSALAREEAVTVPDHAYSVAPMMEVTDRHFRTLARLISRRATLYTEMVVDRTIIHNSVARELDLRVPDIPPLPGGLEVGGVDENLSQHPLVLQLGGSVPDELVLAARIVADYPYTEVNLNCGCPSPKVAGKGRFGASLMRSPEVVAESTRRMAAVLPRHVPVTVKCRIGVDDDDSYESLQRFISIVSISGGVKHFIVHARKAILSGLSPAENRSVPPLKHHYVYQLRNDFPHLTFSINGGLRTVEDVTSHLKQGMHGVMVGRGVMDRPWEALCDIDTVVYGISPARRQSVTRRLVVQWYTEYAEREIEATGAPVRTLLRPLLNLFTGEKNGKRFRRAIDESLRNKSLGFREIVSRCLLVLTSDVLDRPPPSVQRMWEESQSPVSDTDPCSNNQSSSNHLELGDSSGTTNVVSSAADSTCCPSMVSAEVCQQL